MATLLDLKRRLLNLKGKETDLAIKAIMENLEVAADLIAAQLAHGLKSDGKKSDFSYSPFTIAIKKNNRTGLAAITSHITNYDTGESYRNLYGRVKGFLIEFGTTAATSETVSDPREKDRKISERMDGKAFGLTDDSQDEWIRQYVQNSFNKIVQEYLQL